MVNQIINNQNTNLGKYGYTFTRSMYLGLRHSDVSELQKSLLRFKDIYPEGIVTGYFGPATERAVKRFQEKYSLAKIGDPAYGFVGPKTRAKLNEI
jgi:peptidoglycan hydrolase-like protein with peptidoglycan-binding domain